VAPGSAFGDGGAVSAGTTLSGIYVIDAPLAKGGMGELYRGRTIETGDAVAIKLIRADLATNEAALALFRKEASALSRVHHEAIVRYFVFSLDPVLQRHFLAMELVEGPSLSEVLKQGPLRLEDVDRLRKRLALGLQAAHERGIVHRDVSPDNVIVQDGDLEKARIIDFGIARSTRAGDATIIGGGFAGKYNYVSPEQLGLFGGDITAKSDIYSLGLLLAQCLRGKPIDMGGTQAEVIEKRRTRPDLSDVDETIRPLIAQMLEPDPSRRPDTMGAVAATRLAVSTVPSKAPARAPTDKSGRSPRWAIAAIFGTALIGAFAFILWLQIGEPGIESVRYPVATLNPKPAAVLPAQSAGQRIDDYVRHYSGGDCFLALPTRVEAGKARIDGFGSDASPFETFNDDFKKTIGFEPDIDFRRVTGAQCPVLTFLARIATNSEMSPRLEIENPALSDGDVLAGFLQSSASHVQLLVVDDEGLLHDVSDRLEPGRDRRPFAMQFKRHSEGPAKPMLLIALASAAPIAAFKLSGPTPSADLVPVALAAQHNSPFEAALAFFKLN
jgi:eukaryotic-like serine/threonine-protein kinase